MAHTGSSLKAAARPGRDPAGAACSPLRHHTVADVMTSEAVTVTTETPFKDLARLFVARGVTSLLVVGRNGSVAGIVREADLLKKEELQRDLKTGAPLRWRRGLHATAAASVAGEVMTTRVAPARPDMSLGEAAWLMHKFRVTCLPVVAPDGRLAGIVTPRELLRVFLRPDEEIRAEIVRDVIQGCLGTDPARVHVAVRKGMVTVTGQVERRSMLTPMLPLVLSVDGVVDAEADLSYAADDSGRPDGPASRPGRPAPGRSARTAA